MKANKHGLLQLALLAATFLVSMGIFTLSYRYDNKYTAHTVQPINGSLFYTPDQGPVSLVSGWEYYRGKLLTPDDFRETFPLPDGYLAIGQYPGMEAGNPAASPHGSITYRLAIYLPETPAFYTLELPEIYSAYRLYLNDKLAAFQGNPDPDAYLPEVKAGSLTFEGSGTITLLLAVSDWSHLYSGLVYPPAFGSSDSVVSLLDQKFVWCLAAVTLALVLGVFQLILSVLLKSRRSLYSGLICAAFAVSVSSPAIHRLISTGIVPFYSLEIFCRYAMYGLTALLISELCFSHPENKYLVPAVLSWAAAAFPFLALAVSFCASELSRSQMILFSRTSDAYKLLCSLWFLGAVFYSGLKQEHKADTTLLLAGVCAFASSLAADRLYPGFEPIRFGWFSETAGLIFILLLSVLILRDSAVLYRKQYVFAQQKQQLETEIAMQKKHYAALAGQMETIRTMRHDIRHHLSQLSVLLSDGNHTAAKEYLAKLTESALTASPLTFCDAYYVDVLLRFYHSKAKELKVPFTVDAWIPAEPGIPEEDLCVLLGNVLENGLEACVKVPAANRFLSVVLTTKSNALAVEIKNSYTGALISDGDVFVSTKDKNRHGIGLSSVRQIAGKYGGSVFFNTLPGERGIHTFIVQILLITSQQTTLE